MFRIGLKPKPLESQQKSHNLPTILALNPRITRAPPQFELSSKLLACSFITLIILPYVTPCNPTLRSLGYKLIWGFPKLDLNSRWLSR